MLFYSNTRQLDLAGQPVTPATQKAETGGLKIQGHLSQLRETLSQNKKHMEGLETWKMAQRTKSLLCKFEAMSSSPLPT